MRPLLGEEDIFSSNKKIYIFGINIIVCVYGGIWFICV